MLGHKAVATIERHDIRPLGIARRKRFDESLDSLRAMGLSSSAVEQYRRVARGKHTLPHELACKIIKQAAEAAAPLAMVASGDGPA
ncbi:MAG TPA: hypothetical protein VEP50_12590 [bacterium]|nr:hypothetical protein [bacterium]